MGFLGSVVAIAMGAFRNGMVSLDHAYLLCASSLVTASLASFVLGLITAGVIVLSRHCHINPDNVATPIAASLGDITSLALLSRISTILYAAIDQQDWLAPLIIACYILITPLWVWIAKRNKYTNDVLYTGWTPVIVAMLISRLVFTYFLTDGLHLPSVALGQCKLKIYSYKFEFQRWWCDSRIYGISFRQYNRISACDQRSWW